MATNMAEDEDAICSPLPVGGYDMEFVESPPDSWECPVCLSTLRDPHLLSCCGVKICQTCINGIIAANRPCPKCRVEKFTTLLEKELQRCILGLLVKCSLGCQWKGELRHLERHVSSTDEGDCPLAMIPCKNGCGQIMRRSDERSHEEDACSKRPIEFQLARLQANMEQMFTDMKNTYQEEIHNLKSQLATQREELNAMKKMVEVLSNQDHKFTTTIPVFSSSILCIMPKLPNGNIPGVSYFPKEKFVKITGSCEEELEARTHLFLAEYEKMLPRLVKEKFEINEHFPLDSLKGLIDACNKKFSACFVSCDLSNRAIELVSNNASQFEVAKQAISDKVKQKVFRMRFPGNMRQTFTLKQSSIKEEKVDVIVLSIDTDSLSTSSTGGFTSFFTSSHAAAEISTIKVTPGQAVLVRERKHFAENVIYIASMSLQKNCGYFGKEAFDMMCRSVKEAFLQAVSINAKSISFPCEIMSGGMQSNYIIPAVIEKGTEVLGAGSEEGQATDTTLTDIRILVQDDKMSDDQLSSYFKYLASKYNLQ